MTKENQVQGERIEVQCYAGYKADERPVSFSLDTDKRIVEDIIDQWYGEDHTYFKVVADDHKVYILRHEREQDIWTLVDVAERIGIH